jgi:hypothetical protein
VAAAVFHLLGCRVHSPFSLKPDWSEHPDFFIGIKHKAGPLPSKNHKPIISYFKTIIFIWSALPVHKYQKVSKDSYENA